MIRLLKLAGATAVLFLVVACSSAPAGPTATPAGGSPGATAPTLAPTTGATAPPVGGGNECASFPTMDPASPALPSFAPDPALEAHFPTEIDGQPVEELRSGAYLAYLCLGGQAAVDRIRGDVSFNLIQLTFASAKVTVDDDEVSLEAFRAPGQDASAIIATLLAISQQNSDEPVPSLIPSTAGGKSVFSTAPDEDGRASYGYATGDALIFSDDITEAQADKIFAAIQ